VYVFDYPVLSSPPLPRIIESTL